MTGCIPRAPATIDDFLSLIDRCAASVGGENWVGTAILGAQAALVLFVLAMLITFLVIKAAR